MVITSHGNNYFKLQSGESVFLLNPENQRSFKGASAAVFSVWDGTKEESDLLTITHQGEYEVGGVVIRGWQSKHDRGGEHTIYHITFDEITIGVILGTDEAPHGDTLQEIHESDLLFLTVGNGGFAHGAAARLVRSLEPSIVIPAFTDEKEKQLFLKEFGWKESPEEKLTIKKKDFAKGAMKIVVLQS